jgi:integrase
MICGQDNPNTTFPSSALPQREAREMKIVQLPSGRWQLIYSFRDCDGKTAKVKESLPPTYSIPDRIKAESRLIEKAEKRSLKSQAALFEEAVDVVTRQNGGAGMPWIYARIKKDLAGPMDMSFVSRYNRYLDDLQNEGKASNTVANHKSAIQRVLNAAWKRRMIDDIPVRDFDIKRNFRDRVLSVFERQRLENVMEWWVSHLYWSIRLAERRPIRGLSDIWELTRDDLVLFGEGAPYISFRAQKTGLPTIVPLTDIPEVLEYIKHALPDDCPYLFPHLTGDIKSIFDFDGMRRAKWEPMGDPRTHFETLKELAKIKDFHFHDFKRIATTWMLENSYTAEDLLDLRFYATREMIDRCYKKRDGMAVLRRIRVVPQTAPEVKNAANL